MAIIASIISWLVIGRIEACWTRKVNLLFSITVPKDKNLVDGLATVGRVDRALKKEKVRASNKSGTKFRNVECLAKQ